MLSSFPLHSFLLHPYNITIFLSIPLHPEEQYYLPDIT